MTSDVMPHCCSCVGERWVHCYNRSSGKTTTCPNTSRRTGCGSRELLLEWVHKRGLTDAMLANDCMNDIEDKEKLIIRIMEYSFLQIKLQKPCYKPGVALGPGNLLTKQCVECQILPFLTTNASLNFHFFVNIFTMWTMIILNLLSNLSKLLISKFVPYL